MSIPIVKSTSPSYVSLYDSDEEIFKKNLKSRLKASKKATFEALQTLESVLPEVSSFGAPTRWILDLEKALPEKPEPVQRNRSVQRSIESLEVEPKAHTSTSERVKHLFAETMQGAIAHHVVEDVLGKQSSIAFEVASGTFLDNSKSGSKKPIRESVLSSVSHLAILESTAAAFETLPGMLPLAEGAVLGLEATPAYAALAGAHAVGHLSRLCEQKLGALKETYETDKVERPSTFQMHDPEHTDDPYVHTVAVEKVAKVLQKPSEMIHEVHHFLTHAAGHVLEAIEPKDQQMAELIQQGADVPLQLHRN